MNGTARQALWSQLVSAGVAVGDMPADARAQGPWYVRVMLCIAGLIAAAFLLAFVGAAFAFIVESKTACLAAGLMLMTAGYALFRLAPRSDFGAMFALAISFAGQALLIYGVLGLFARDVKGTAYLLISAIEVVLAVAMPNVIHRFASAYAAALALGFALESAGIGFFAASLTGAGVAALWLNEARLARINTVVTPVAYGLTVAFIQMEATSRLDRGLLMDMIAPPVPGGRWLGEALVIVTLLACVATLLKRAASPWHAPRTAYTLLAVASIGAASFKAPGIAAGLMILVLGYANGNRVLTGLGVAALLFYVCAYYYQLDITLLAKSAVLAATGLALLGARWVMLNFAMPDTAADA